MFEGTIKWINSEFRYSNKMVDSRYNMVHYIINTEWFWTQSWFHFAQQLNESLIELMNTPTDQKRVHTAEKVSVSVFCAPSGPVLSAATPQKITFWLKMERFFCLTYSV